ncbi:hypothetical protein GCM10022233_71480 [Streptomyces shaanxiensis]|uniref:Uncharacterized protein n=1 Tax=Streptomyces shaanxiensis TaxID=653357 RepID=A0ABP7W4E3_9ACTN
MRGGGYMRLLSAGETLSSSDISNSIRHIEHVAPKLEPRVGEVNGRDRPEVAFSHVPLAHRTARTAILAECA